MYRSAAASIVKRLAVLALGLGFMSPVAADELSETEKILAQEGISVSRGAAAGYVPDRVCGDCHADKAESFAEMGMARSFYRPVPDRVIEDFTPGTYHHEPSDRHYRMELRDGAYWFHRHRLAPDGSEVNRFSVRVDWIMGSGNHSRVYLYQTPDGALYQLPLAWYSQDGKWAMAPGFESSGHPGVLREVPQRCMGCHNSYAETPADGDRDGMPPVYPAEMPEGISCQRCHGPGAQHVRYALTGEAELEELHAAIVQPGKLEREKLYSICYGCHMQPTIAVNGQLRPGRGHYSFRPGTDLRDFLVQLDITDTRREKAERFEINHHPYRLEQSTCFVASEGRLGCLTCHDPHVKIKPEARAAHYRKACLGCHQTDDDGLPRMVLGEGVHPAIAATDDCTACHMPERRTQDVIEVWMTDHRIVRDPGPGDLLAPIEKVQAEVIEIYLARAEAGVPEDEALALKIIATLQHTGYRAGYAANAMAELLQRWNTQRYEPWMHLLRAYITQNRFVEAERIADHALGLDPRNPTIVNVAAAAYFKTGSKARALALLRGLLETDPDTASLHYNLSSFLLQMEAYDEARAEAQAALRLRPNHWLAMLVLATVASERGETETAIALLRQALAIEPGRDDIRQDLIAHLREAGRGAEADLHAAMLP